MTGKACGIGRMSKRKGALNGGYGWDRTTDLTIMSRALSPAELRSHEGGEENTEAAAAAQERRRYRQAPARPSAGTGTGST